MQEQNKPPVFDFGVDAEGHIGYDIVTPDGCGVVFYDADGEATPYNIRSLRIHHKTNDNVTLALFENPGREGSPVAVILLDVKEFSRIWFAADALGTVTVRRAPQPEGETDGR